ncbi:hypothetical protein BCR39DRAFT_557623 [Naematelia encephala]|uniref:Putative lipoate-protein ligase A n=1 Tax=Naematelia encephala TaxID=71784 RepID=A0A1Y2BBL9_9TREE|nr:hypothetical protein BCR39DRAFT_557623 [Naematelia encephala]
MLLSRTLALSQPCSSLQASRQINCLFTCRFITSTSSRSENKSAQPSTAATATANIELSAPVTYLSESHDPYFNLAYEDHLLRSTPHNQPVLFMYRNRPCVVIGRNQNPWKETTPRLLRGESIPLIRRRSGGGTVYHDMGNTNFSIILPRLMFTRAHGAELVARAIREKLGITQCGVNERNDVIIRDDEHEFKVSGSAYKIIQHRAYHHGTMLISSSLSELGKSLKSSSPHIETKGIPSFRSPVTTLNTYLPSSRQGRPIKHDEFVSAVSHEFASVYAGPGKQVITYEVSENLVREVKVWDGVRELKSWEWQYGQTPEFTNRLETVLPFGEISASLTSRHALITSLTFHLTPSISATTAETTVRQEFLDALALSLIGARYEALEGADGPEDPAYDTPQWRELSHEIISWLRQAM